MSAEEEKEYVARTNRKFMEMKAAKKKLGRMLQILRKNETPAQKIDRRAQEDEVDRLEEEYNEM